MGVAESHLNVTNSTPQAATLQITNPSESKSFVCAVAAMATTKLIVNRNSTGKMRGYALVTFMDGRLVKFKFPIDPKDTQRQVILRQGDVVFDGKPRGEPAVAGEPWPPLDTYPSGKKPAGAKPKPPHAVPPPGPPLAQPQYAGPPPAGYPQPTAQGYPPQQPAVAMSRGIAAAPAPAGPFPPQATAPPAYASAPPAYASAPPAPAPSPYPVAPAPVAAPVALPASVGSVVQLRFDITNQLWLRASQPPDGNGRGGALCDWRINPANGHLRLEAVAKPGTFLGVHSEDGRLFLGQGGPLCELDVFPAPDAPGRFRLASTQGAHFQLSLSAAGQTQLRTAMGSVFSVVEKAAGAGPAPRAAPAGRSGSHKVMLLSLATHKHVRIVNGQLDANGQKGRFCVFQSEQQGTHHRLKLALNPKQFINIRGKDGTPGVGAGGALCNFNLVPAGGAFSIQSAASGDLLAFTADGQPLKRQRMQHTGTWFMLEYC